MATSSSSSPALIACLVGVICALLLADAFPLTDKLLHEAEALASHTLTNDRPFVHDARQQFVQLLRMRHRQRHHRQKLNWLKEALIYLHRFGYLSKEHLSKDDVHKALQAFQNLAGVDKTGKLDKATIDKMRMPRCGNADIDRKKTTVDSDHARFKRFSQVSKWLNKLDENDVLRLKWHIQRYTNDISKSIIRSIVKKAFKLWADQVALPSLRTVQLDFTEAANSSVSDVNIMWAQGEHGDDFPFDNNGSSSNILAHTFYPNYQEKGTLNGDIHFDNYEKWVIDNATTDETTTHFPYVLVHEIGHSLGLGHSNRQKAVMHPIYKKYALEDIQLDIDDKCALNWNYIGPSNTCLFVWLMVELLPKAAESNKHGSIGSVIRRPEKVIRSQDLPNLTIDEKVRRIIEAFKESKIPKCTNRNRMQEKYVRLLQRRLDFSSETAAQYGPVVCGFLAGLSRMVHENATEISESSSSEENGPLEMIIHRYRSRKSSRSALDHIVRATIDSVVPRSALDYSDTVRSRRSLQRTDPNHTFSQTSFSNKNFFNKKFFDNLFLLLAEHQ